MLEMEPKEGQLAKPGTEPARGSPGGAQVNAGTQVAAVHPKGRVETALPLAQEGTGTTGALLQLEVDPRRSGALKAAEAKFPLSYLGLEPA